MEQKCHENRGDSPRTALRKGKTLWEEGEDVFAPPEHLDTMSLINPLIIALEFFLGVFYFEVRFSK